MKVYIAVNLLDGRAATRPECVFYFKPVFFADTVLVVLEPVDIDPKCCTLDMIYREACVADPAGFPEVLKMRRSLLFKSIIPVVGMVLLACAAWAQQPTAAPDASSGQTQPPVSISPAMPVVAAPSPDPAKMAESGTKQPAVNLVDVATYVLGPEDQITVSMWGEPQFDGSYTIRPDGKISLKLIGEIQAAGRTPMQLQDAIDTACLKVLRTPRSTVNVIGVHSKHVYFDGEGIASPGAMDLVIPIHLLEAISARGGFKDFANKNKIHILRDGKPLYYDSGGKKTQYFKYRDMVSGKHPESNPELLDNDHVIVD